MNSLRRIARLFVFSVVVLSLGGAHAASSENLDQPFNEVRARMLSVVMKDDSDAEKKALLATVADAMFDMNGDQKTEYLNGLLTTFDEMERDVREKNITTLSAAGAATLMMAVLAIATMEQKSKATTVAATASVVAGAWLFYETMKAGGYENTQLGKFRASLADLRLSTTRQARIAEFE